MKNNIATLALLGAISSTEAISLQSYLYKKSHAKGKDWDDMLDNTGVFGAASYASDSPSGYADAVTEVVKEKEDVEVHIAKAQQDAELKVVQDKLNADNLAVKKKADEEASKAHMIVEQEEKKKAEAKAILDKQEVERKTTEEAAKKK